MFCYLANCKDPGIPPNGARTGNNFEHGQLVTFLCSYGYTLIGTHSMDCRNGVWSSSLPQCKSKSIYIHFRHLFYYLIKALVHMWISQHRSLFLFTRCSLMSQNTSTILVLNLDMLELKIVYNSYRALHFSWYSIKRSQG